MRYSEHQCVCELCGLTFQSRRNTASVCPKCVKNRARAKWRGYDYHSDAYTGGGYKADSVYSSLCTIALQHDEAPCRCCKITKPLVNGYCSECRTMGGNERQVLNPKELQHKQAVGRSNSAESPWRFKSYK